MFHIFIAYSIPSKSTLPHFYIATNILTFPYSYKIYYVNFKIYT